MFAAIAGAIISSLASMLNSVSTILTMVILRRSIPVSVGGVVRRWRDVRELLRDWSGRLFGPPEGS